MHESPRQNRWILWGIALAVAGWGVYHAVGAYRFNHNPWRPLVVAACVAGFLGGWGLLLLRRNLQAPAADQNEAAGRPKPP